MKMASMVLCPCLKPNWLSFIDASVLAFILFRNIRLKTFPGIDSKDIQYFAGSSFVWIGVISIQPSILVFFGLPYLIENLM